ncbi:PaaI family thioesterase [uncultured Croceitalea sp.]|uniref:PaaI family thioesterase n=1 Tax=uncultured Croceitalea sp. TaxID=1798908 RepID=UPI00330664AB
MNNITNIPLMILQKSVGQPLAKSPSAFGRWLNPTVVSAEEGKVVFSFRVREDMTNPVKLLHGGIIAAMMDDTLGATMLSLGDANFKISINLVIDYFNAANVDDIVTVESDIIKNGKNIINATCIMKNQDNKIIAKGNSNLFHSNIEVQL